MSLIEISLCSRPAPLAKGCSRPYPTSGKRARSSLKRHHLPRPVLRPVDLPEKAKDGTRTSTQSAPNSYMSNSGAGLDVDPVTANGAPCRAALNSMDLEHETLLKTLSTTAITNAPPDIIPLLPLVPSIHTAGSDIGIHAMGSMSAVRSRSLSFSTKSRGINYHALLKRSPSASDIGLPLPPVL